MAHLLFALVFGFAMSLLYSAYYSWPVERFSFYGLASYLAQSAWFYFWIAVILVIFGLEQRLSRLMISLCYAAPLGSVAGIALDQMLQSGLLPASVLIIALYLCAYLFTATIIFRTIGNSFNVARWKAFSPSLPQISIDGKRMQTTASR